jgi:hypothetical protein
MNYDRFTISLPPMGTKLEIECIRPGVAVRPQSVQDPVPEALEQLRCSQANFDNLARVAPPALRESPLYKIARLQLDCGVDVLEGKSPEPRLAAAAREARGDA